MATGKGSGRNGAMCVIWGIIWFLILIFLGWPISYMLAWLYILLLPFSVCIDALGEIEEFLKKVIELPKTYTEKMLKGEPLLK